ncbi:MAG: hypothetical protein AAGG46_02230, partial [Planctomycetota bacterium]
MPGGKRTHRRDRVARRFVCVLIGAGLLAAFGPTLVGSTGLRQWALDRALPASVGRLTATGANFSWWSPVELSGVQLVDPAGTVVFRAATVRVDRTLWQLAGNSADLGAVRVDRPMVAVFVRPDGSNVEDLIALLESERAADKPLEQTAAEDDLATPPLIEITNGAVQIVEAAGQQRSWVLDEVNARVAIGGGNALPTVAASAIVYAGVIDTAAAPVRASGQVAPARDAGTLRIENSTNGPAAPLAPQGAPQSTQQLALTVDRLPVEPLEPWLARFDPTVRLAGTLSGNGGVQWRPPPTPAGPAAPNHAAPNQAALNLPTTPDRATAILQSGLVTSGTLAGDRISVRLGVLGDRPMQLTRAELPWRVRTTADGRLAVEQLDLASEFGDAKLRATLDRGELAALLAGDWSAPRTASLESDVDIAQLARVAPGLLRLKEDAAIQAGRANVSLASQPVDPTRPTLGRRLTGTADTSDLTAVVGGRVIEWNRPLVVRATATEEAGAWRVDELVCQSDFVDATASGGPAGATADLEVDLDKLTRQLGRFVDLTGWRLAGRGRAKVNLQRTAADRFATQANVDLTGVALATPDRTLLNEPRLVATLVASGTNDANLQPTRVDSARLQVTAGGDSLTVETTGPLAADGATPIKAQLTGELGNWLTRLRLVAPDTATAVERVAGAAEASAAGVVGGSVGGIGGGADRFDLSNFQLTATGFELDAGDLRIREPRVEASGSVLVDPAAGRLSSDELRVVTSSASLLGRGINVRLSEPAAAAGNAGLPSGIQASGSTASGR